MGRYKIRNNPALPHAVNINRRSLGAVAQMWLKHKGNPVVSHHKVNCSMKLNIAKKNSVYSLYEFYLYFILCYSASKETTNEENNKIFKFLFLLSVGNVLLNVLLSWLGVFHLGGLF